jgi:hypothetical protein
LNEGVSVTRFIPSEFSQQARILNEVARVQRQFLSERRMIVAASPSRFGREDEREESGGLSPRHDGQNHDRLNTHFGHQAILLVVDRDPPTQVLSYIREQLKATGQPHLLPEGILFPVGKGADDGVANRGLCRIAPRHRRANDVPPLDEVHDAPVSELRNRHIGEGVGQILVLHGADQRAELGQECQPDFREEWIVDVADRERQSDDPFTGGVERLERGALPASQVGSFHRGRATSERDQLFGRLREHVLVGESELGNRLTNDLVSGNARHAVPVECQSLIEVFDSTVRREDAEPVVGKDAAWVVPTS